jgi:hypothetical protein
MVKQPDFESRESNWHPQGMRILNTEDSNEKGVCYGSSLTTWVSLLKHITQRDIEDTCVEESIHQAIRDETIGLPNESELFDVEQEEWMVERMFWTLEGWYLVD